VANAGAGARRLDRPSVAALVAAAAFVPIWLGALAVVWWASRPLVSFPFWWLPVAYLATGVLLFARPVQRLVVRRLLGARAPTPQEAAVLEPLWVDVCLHSRLRADRFVLAVADADELNAFASSGHLVVVTTAALRSLPPAELAGVLAHEVGHHLGFYGVALLTGYWLALPVQALASFGFLLERVARVASDAAGAGPVAVVGDAVGLALRAVAWVFLAPVVAFQAVGGIVGRSAELRADERAVQLGFGRELAAAMRRNLHAEPTHAERSVAERLFGAHPPMRTRVARVEALTRRSGP
jgi:Zn-dependent protease with chaperone function